MPHNTVVLTAFKPGRGFAGCSESFGVAVILIGPSQSLPWLVEALNCHHYFGMTTQFARVVERAAWPVRLKTTIGRRVRGISRCADISFHARDSMTMKPLSYQTCLPWLASFVCGVTSCGILLYAITRPYPAAETSAGANFAYNLVFLPLVAGSWLMACLAALALQAVYRSRKEARLRSRVALIAPLIVLILPTVLQVLVIGAILLYVFVLLAILQLRMALGI